MADAPPPVRTGSLPEMYERHLVAPLFRPFAQALLERAGIRRGDRVLDVACGTGIVARLAHDLVGDDGRVAGIDASPGMLDVARRLAPAIDWRQGNATQAPLANGEVFDLVSCHQGLQFFGDKPAAAREMHRALAHGGRLAVATWRPVDKVPLMRDLRAVAVERLGEFVDQRHSFGDPDAIQRLLADAGFTDVHVDIIERRVRIDSGAGTFAQLNAMAMVGMSPAAKAMSDEARAKVVSAMVADSRRIIEPYLAGDSLVFDISSNLALARRP